MSNITAKEIHHQETDKPIKNSEKRSRRKYSRINAVIYGALIAVTAAAEFNNAIPARAEDAIPPSTPTPGESDPSLVVTEAARNAAETEVAYEKLPETTPYRWVSDEVKNEPGHERFSGEVYQLPDGKPLKPGDVIRVSVYVPSDSLFGLGTLQNDENISAWFSEQNMLSGETPSPLLAGATYGRYQELLVVVGPDGKITFDVQTEADESPGSCFVIVNVLGIVDLNTPVPPVESTATAVFATATLAQNPEQDELTQPPSDQDEPRNPNPTPTPQPADTPEAPPEPGAESDIELDEIPYRGEMDEAGLTTLRENITSEEWISITDDNLIILWLGTIGAAIALAYWSWKDDETGNEDSQSDN